MSISNISVGASFAGIQAHKARHEMNGSIMRLSSGNRTLFGADAGGASVGQSLKARSASHYVAARNALMFSLCLLLPVLQFKKTEEKYSGWND